MFRAEQQLDGKHTVRIWWRVCEKDYSLAVNDAVNFLQSSKGFRETCYTYSLNRRALYPEYTHIDNKFLPNTANCLQSYKTTHPTRPPSRCLSPWELHISFRWERLYPLRAAASLTHQVTCMHNGTFLCVNIAFSHYRFIQPC